MPRILSDKSKHLFVFQFYPWKPKISNLPFNNIQHRLSSMLRLLVHMCFSLLSSSTAGDRASGLKVTCPAVVVKKENFTLSPTSLTFWKNRSSPGHMLYCCDSLNCLHPHRQIVWHGLILCLQQLQDMRYFQLGHLRIYINNLYHLLSSVGTGNPAAHDSYSCTLHDTHSSSCRLSRSF